MSGALDKVSRSLGVTIRTAVILAATLGLASLSVAAQDKYHSAAEAQLHEAISDLLEGRVNDSLGKIDKLLQEYPNFRLAHLVRGDLLLSRTRVIERVGAKALPGERLEELRAELAARTRDASNRPAADRVPRYLPQLSPEQTHAIVVDSHLSRVYLFRNESGSPRLVRDFYSSLGKRGVAKQREGDKKTPIGVYYITSAIPGSKLPDFYGWGALPINYPNEWDTRLGRTGNGIWIHGVPPETYARAPFASDGCVALANPEMAELAEHVHTGVTPVIIAQQVEWVTPAALRSEADDFRRTLATWQHDWESRNTEKYLSHYAASFRAPGLDLATWSARKRNINAARAWIGIDITNVSALRSPEALPLMVVTFEQGYRSEGGQRRTRKRQYWVQEAGGWKIAYEAAVGRPPTKVPESFRQASSMPGAQQPRAPAAPRIASGSAATGRPQ